MQFRFSRFAYSHLPTTNINLFLKPFQQLNVMYQTGQKRAYLWSQRLIHSPFHIRLEQFVFYHVVLLVLFVLFPQDGLLGEFENLFKVGLDLLALGCVQGSDGGDLVEVLLELVDLAGVLGEAFVDGSEFLGVLVVEVDGFLVEGGHLLFQDVNCADHAALGHGKELGLVLIERSKFLDLFSLVFTLSYKLFNCSLMLNKLTLIFPLFQLILLSLRISDHIHFL
jgi:hypothetical protein